MVDDRSEKCTYWLCTERRPGSRCTASVLECAGEYRRGNNTHIHPPRVDQLCKTLVQKDVRKLAKDDVFRSAHSIVQEAVQHNMDPARPVEAMAPVHSLVREFG